MTIDNDNTSKMPAGQPISDEEKKRIIEKTFQDISDRASQPPPKSFFELFNEAYNLAIDHAIEVVVLNSPLPKQEGVPLQEPCLTIFNKLQALKK